MRRLAACFAASSFLAVAPAAQPPERVSYQAPVSGPVIDGFRPPATPFGPGNRGVDFATAPGEPVIAAAAGVVTFAGPVGGSLHVVVLHPDGIRTSYSYLASISARRGERVEAGQPVGAAAASVHFGARLGDDYLDPMLLFAGRRPRVRLVADDGRRLDAVGAERRRLAAALAGLRRVAAAVAPSPADVQSWATHAQLFAPAAAVQAALAAARADQAGCTPAGVVPARITGRRIAVLVGGLGSPSGRAAILRVQAASALGYAPGDVHLFSYRGGTAAQRPYTAADTARDVRTSAEALRRLLLRVNGDAPGVPVDVLAHSLGGVVARTALAGRGPPAIANLVALGAPFQGADLAGVVAGMRRTVEGRLLLAGVEGTGVVSVASDAPAVVALDPASSFMSWFRKLPPTPAGRVTSIAARADLMVPSPRSWLSGATNVVVTVGGLNQHGDLPGSAAARREVALALAGRKPTCQGFLDRAADALAGRLIQAEEQALTPFKLEL